MANQKIAKVKLLPSQDNTSHIQVIYDNVKNIKVYLPTNSGNQAYRQSVLQDFIYMTQGYHVNEFESSREISNDTTQLFLSICQRSNVSGGASNSVNNSVNNGLSSGSLGSLNSSSHNGSLNSSSLSSALNSLVSLSSELNSGLNSDLSMDGELFAELTRRQRFPLMENRMFRSNRQSSNPFSEIANVFHTISQNNTFPPDVRRLYTEAHQLLLNPENISENHIRNLMSNLSRVISRQTNIEPPPIQHNNLSSNQYSNLSGSLSSNLSNSQFNNLSNSHSNSQPIHQPRNDMSFTDIISLFSNSLPPHLPSSLNSNSSPEIPIPEPTPIDDTDPPARFAVNERSHREVIETQALPSELSSHEETKELLALPHQTSIAPQRNNIQESTIKRLAANVKHILDTTSLRAPDFTNTTRSGYRKIKNFIKNITKVWLTQEEIDVFNKEMQSLNNQNTD